MTDTVTLRFGAGGTVEAQATVEAPRRLGHVTLLEEVGRGGMGVVWRGRDEFLDRQVAVKLFRNAQLAADPVLRQQFIDGARAAAVVKHPGVVSVYHADERDSLIYIVMEYVQGCTLADVQQHGGCVDRRVAALVIVRVLEALCAIHDAQVVHRDLKPSNVLFNGQGDLLVSDFGLSHQRTATSSDEAGARGTPPYMAPEMFTGDASFQSDVYAVGIMYFELLAGQRPFQAESVFDYQAQHQDRPLPLELLANAQPGELVEEIIQRAANKKRIFRYKSAAHMLKAVVDAHPRLLEDQTLDRTLRDLVLESGRRCPVAEPGQDRIDSPAGTYFDLLSRRADRKRRQKGSDSC